MMQVDVLVIGGGLAGLMAAITANEQGVNVLLVSKGKIARSGNTLVSGGGISGALDDATGVNNAAAFYKDIIKSGKGLADEQLADILARKSGMMIQKLYDYGVKFVKEADGSFRVRRPPGHSVARNIPTKWDGVTYANRGLSFSLPLYNKCQTDNIPMLEGWNLVDLLKHDNNICGAVFVNKENVQLTVQAKSIILACGGYGFLFAKSNNTSDILGEGLAAALRAGCRVRDMEQVQFYPTMMFEPIKITASNPLFGEGAVLRNRNKERFMPKYDSNGDMATRDNMARAIFLEIQAGLGIDNSVYFDCTDIAESTLRERFGNFYEFLKKNGIDLTRDYLKVSPCVHYTLGGIVIDTNCQTDVVGLYAAGEITGGVHGANRLSGAALMETCVFGMQAGEQAAQYAKNNNFLNNECLNNDFRQNTVPNIEQTSLARLRSIMWQHASLVRTQDGLTQAKNELYSLKENAPVLTSAFTVCHAVVQSSILRQESRGAHYRADYPKQNESLHKSTYCRLDSCMEVKAAWL